MISPEAGQRLQELIQTHGRDVLADPAACERLVLDSMRDHTADASLLLAALRAGIPQALLSGAADINALVTKLQVDSFVGAEDAASAVQAWAVALGVTPEPAPATTPPAPTSPGHGIAPPVAGPPAVLPYASQLPPRKSSVGLIVTLLILAAVVVFGTIGFAVYMSTRQFAQVTSDLSSGSYDFEEQAKLDAYNVKLSEIFDRFGKVSTEFDSKSEANAANKSQQKRAAVALKIWRDYTGQMNRIVSDLAALAPPSEVAKLHQKLLAYMRKLSVMLGKATHALAAHDDVKFVDLADQFSAYAEAEGKSLDKAVEAAGYSPSAFDETGTFIRD